MLPPPHTHIHAHTHACTHTQDGEINENLLADLAEKYAGRFQAESLDVYDALKDIWRQSTNKSSFVTPVKKVCLSVCH